MSNSPEFEGDAINGLAAAKRINVRVDARNAESATAATELLEEAYEDVNR